MKPQCTAAPAEELSTVPSDSHRDAAAATAAANSTAAATVAAKTAAAKLAASNAAATAAAAAGSTLEAPNSSRSLQKASVQEAVPAEQQPVNLIAKPELYTALTAAVAAIVQQAGLPQIQPAAECLRGISLQYLAGGKGSEPEGQQPKVEGEQAQVEGHRAASERQHRATQQQTASGTDQINQTAACDSLKGDHPQKVNVQQGLLPDAAQLPAGHAQCNAALGQGLQQVGPQLRADGSDEGVTTGHESGQLQAWQAQIQQAMQVLQATLQSACKAGASSAGALPRQAPLQPLPCLLLCSLNTCLISLLVNSVITLWLYRARFSLGWLPIQPVQSSCWWVSVHHSMHSSINL